MLQNLKNAKNVPFLSSEIKKEKPFLHLWYFLINVQNFSQCQNDIFVYFYIFKHALHFLVALYFLPAENIVHVIL